MICMTCGSKLLYLDDITRTVKFWYCEKCGFQDLKKYESPKSLEPLTHKEDTTWKIVSF